MTTGSALSALTGTLRDVLPIFAVLGFFQLVALRRRVPDLRRVLVGLAMVVTGITLFVYGLETALFPIGRSMAEQLTDPVFLGGSPGETLPWWRYYWVFVFGAAIGFSSAMAEPALMAVGLKAEDVSGGAVRALPLRVVVAVGLGASVALSALRIVLGVPLYVFVLAGYAIVTVQTLLAPKEIVPLAYDSGGVTTSTVTVPLVTALGLGLASSVPGRSELIDGFGVVALGAMFPLIAVLGYAQLAAARARRARTRSTGPG